MKLKVVVIAVAILSIVNVAQAQYRPQKIETDLKDRVFFGGGGSLSGGSNFLSIGVSPTIGYKITDSFAAGLQVTYLYTKYGDYSASDFGGGPFAMYSFTEKIFVYSQYEYLSVQPFVVGGTSNDRISVNSLFTGLGYNEPVNDRVSFQLLILYNVLYYSTTAYQYYQSPFQFRVGILTGF